VTPAGLTSGNYEITFAKGTLTVEQAQLAVAAAAKTKTYGQADPELTYSVTGGALANGDGFTGALTRAAGENAGSYAIQQGTLSAGHNYALSFTPAALTIRQKGLTVKAQDATKVYGAANPAFSVGYDGFVNSESASVLGGTLAYATTATATSNVGSYTVTPSGLTSANYAITYANGTLAVTKAPLTVAGTSRSKTYGVALTAVDLAGTLTGIQNRDSITVALSSTGAGAAAGVGTYPIVPTAQGTEAVLANYTVSATNGTLTVNPAALTVTANNATKAFGEANPAFAASYSGFVNGETAAALGGTLGFTTAATAGSASGAYDVTPSGLTATNYAITFVKGTLTVSKASSNIEYNGPAFLVTSKAGERITVQMSATLSNWSSAATGVTVRFSVFPATGDALTCNATVSTAGTAACPVAGLGDGQYQIRSEILENGFYRTATDEASLTVSDPGTGFTTGGGSIRDASGARSTFAITAKFNRSGGVQGNNLFIYRQRRIWAAAGRRRRSTTGPSARRVAWSTTCTSSRAARCRR
jgi:hypothetical protein